MRGRFAGLAIGLAAAVAPSVAMAEKPLPDSQFAHPLLNYTKGSTQYRFDFCATVEDAVGDDGAILCRGALGAFEKALKSGAEDEPQLTSSTYKSDLAAYMATPPKKTWNTATVPFCIAKNGKPLLVGGIAPNGYVYKLSSNGFKGNCEDYVTTSPTSWSMLDAQWKPTSQPVYAKYKKPVTDN
jgi:hypothetical protein